MAKYVGLDWAGKGWFGVVLRDSAEDDECEYETEVFPTILSVWHKHRDAERIFIDIPIGLPREGRRKCDEDASETLDKRRSSVFWTPCREAIYKPTLKDAKEANLANTDSSISNQTWAIMPRIREVDEFLVEFTEARGVVREIHPEICFWAFAGREMDHKKSEEEGLDERKDVLEDQFGEWTRELYDVAVREHIDPPSHARTLSKNAKDDILDAMAAALTAQGSDDQLETLPEGTDDPPTDARGLPMKMVYRTEWD